VSLFINFLPPRLAQFCPVTDAEEYIAERAVVRSYAAQLFEELRPRSPFFVAIYTYARILEGINSYPMLTVLLFLLTYFNASNAYIILVRRRLENLPAY
jgi:hypothetical protein